MDNKRKRPTGGSEAAAPAASTPARASRKRAKAAEEVEEFHLETDVTLLQYQHRAMWLRLKEKNRVISELKDRLDSVSVAHYNCQQVTAAVVSQVTQLATDLQASASRLDRSLPARASPSDGSAPARTRPDLLELLVGFGSQGLPVPHASAALKTEPADSKANPAPPPPPKSEAADADPTEAKDADGASEDSDEEAPLARYSHVTPESLQQLTSGLRDQSQFTSASMTAVVEAIERLAGIQSDILSVLRSPSGAATAPDSLSQRLADLETQLDTSQRSTDSLQAQNHSLSAQLQAKTHDYVLVCRRADELYDELENTKVALSRARRKLDRLGVPSTTAAAADSKSGAGLPVLKVPSLGAAGSQPAEASSAPSTETKVKENGEAMSADVQAQLETLQTVAEQRLTEIAQLRDERLALIKEIDRLKAAPVSEEQVRQSAVYQVLHHKCQVYVRDANDRKDRYDGLVREFTELRAELDAVRKQLTMAEDSKQRAFKEQFDRLSERLRAVTAEKDRLQLKLDSIPKEHDPDLKAQLIKQCEQTLQQQTLQLKALQEERKRHQSAVRSTDQQTKDMLLQALVQAQDRERAWTDREKQLRAQIEAASSRPRSGDSDRDELTVLRATEQRLSQDLRAAREELEALKQKQKGSDEVTQLRAELSAARAELSSVKLECERLRGECQALGSALDEIGPGFEESVEQNKTLLKQLQDAESAHSRLLTEKLKVSQSVGAIKTERDRLAVKLQSMDAQTQAQKDAYKALEGTVQSLQELNAKHLERLNEMERRAQELQEQKDSNVQMMMDFQIQAETARSQAEQQLKRVEEEQKKTDSVERKLKRAEETVRDLTKKQEKQKAALGAGSASASSAVTKGLEEELAVLKHQIRCSVCSDRHKSVVITKCFHMFCKECIERNLKIRHRKCPGCGISFGQDDVHEIYLT